MLTCYTCDKLFRLCDAAVKTFSESSSRLSGMIGDDFQRAVEECDRLRQACQTARELLSAHIRSDHSISRERLRF